MWGTEPCERILALESLVFVEFGSFLDVIEFSVRPLPESLLGLPANLGIGSDELCENVALIFIIIGFTVCVSLRCLVATKRYGVILKEGELLIVDISELLLARDFNFVFFSSLRELASHVERLTAEQGGSLELLHASRVCS